MGNKFFITGAKGLNNDKCFGEVINTFPEGVDKCIKQLIFDTDADAPEQEEMLAYIDGQSITGVKISLLKDGTTTVFLGWSASGMDVHLCFEYLRTVQRLYPGSVITCCDDEGKNTDNLADISEEAMDNEWGKRIDVMVGLMELPEEVINIPAVRYTYHFMPSKFAEETEGMELKDKIMKLYDDIIEMQWYDAPEHKAYMLRWNTAISNFKITDFEKCMDLFKDDNFCMSWSIWDWQDARVGDTVYLLRVGEGTTGIVMRGEIISEPYVEEDWSGKGRVVHYVDFRVTEMMHPEKATIPTAEDIAVRWHDIDCEGGHSGTLLDVRDADSLDKYFDRYLVDNREQFSINENNGIALCSEEIPTEYRDYFDPHQGHGGHWETIVDTDKVELVDFLMKHIEKAKHVGSSTCTVNEDDEIKAYNVVGLSTEDKEIGMHVLVIETEEANEFRTAYPELKDAGSEVSMKLVKINEYANGIEAVLTCETMEGNLLSFFESDYYLNKASYKIGETYTFKLAALANHAEEMPEDERTFTMSIEETVRMAEASGEELERDENGDVIPHTIIMDQLAACLNTVKEVPDNYEFQSPVTNVKSTKILGTPMYSMNITVVRTEDDPDAVVIPLYTKKDFFEKKPKKNAPVRGWLWMFGKKLNN